MYILVTKGSNNIITVIVLIILGNNLNILAQWTTKTEITTLYRLKRQCQLLKQKRKIYTLSCSEWVCTGDKRAVSCWGVVCCRRWTPDAERWGSPVYGVVVEWGSFITARTGSAADEMMVSGSAGDTHQEDS